MKIQINTDNHIDGSAALSAHISATLEQAVHGAAQKMVHLLDSTLGRLNEHRDKTSAVPEPVSKDTPNP